MQTKHRMSLVIGIEAAALDPTKRSCELINTLILFIPSIPTPSDFLHANQPCTYMHIKMGCVTSLGEMYVKVISPWKDVDHVMSAVKNMAYISRKPLPIVRDYTAWL